MKAIFAGKAHPGAVGAARRLLASGLAVVTVNSPATHHALQEAGVAHQDVSLVYLPFAWVMYGKSDDPAQYSAVQSINALGSVVVLWLLRFVPVEENCACLKLNFEIFAIAGACVGLLLARCEAPHARGVFDALVKWQNGG